jgi:hypothetical protein
VSLLAAFGVSFTDWCAGIHAGRLREMAARGECTGYCI